MELAHEGRPLAPHELWGAWNADPLIVLGLVVLGALYWRGRTRAAGARRWQGASFSAGLVVVAVALLTPLDAASGVLASAHMVQHLLLTLVAAPLLALSAPAATLLRGGPAAVRAAVTPWRRRLRPGVAGLHALRNPVVVWLLHVATLWGWHAAALYDASLASPVVHAVQHSTFLLTAVLFWRVVVGARAARTSPGLGVLLVFGMAVQSALLALLLTFARAPWYAGYTTTTRAWGMEQLADQQLAGVLMWVPAGVVYVGVAITLLVTWLRATADGDGARAHAPVPAAPTPAGRA